MVHGSRKQVRKLHNPHTESIRLSDGLEEGVFIENQEATLPTVERNTHVERNDTASTLLRRSQKTHNTPCERWKGGSLLMANIPNKKRAFNMSSKGEHQNYELKQ